MWSTIKEYQSADPHLATALEGCFIGNRKQPQSDVVEESRVPKVCLAMPACRLKVDKSNIFFVLQEAVAQKPHFRRPM
jgi:hypothetical protein